jgi:hypothetical protein
MYIVILIVFTVIGFLISNRLKSKFNQYSQFGLRSNLSGAEIAVKMLNYYGIRDVQVLEGQGFLSDHYNPSTKTVSLSPDVYHGRSVAAAAVASHECGHAVQHAEAYTALTMRSALVPVVQASSTIQQFLFMGFAFGIGSNALSGNGIFALILVATFGATALFSLITLPVEFDASKRALVWLDQSNMAQGEEYEGAKDALWWAAMTYVSQALGALVMFVYFLINFLSRGDD